MTRKLLVGIEARYQEAKSGHGWIGASDQGFKDYVVLPSRYNHVVNKLYNLAIRLVTGQNAIIVRQ